MSIKTDIQAKIVKIQVAANAQKAAIQAKADADIAEFQVVLDENEGWLLRNASIFKEKVDRIIAKLQS